MKKTLLYTVIVIVVALTGCTITKQSPALIIPEAPTADYASSGHVNATCDSTAGLDTLVLDDLTIEEALQIAEANRPEITALRHRIGMAEGEAVQAGLWPNPILSLGLEGYTPNRDNMPPDLARLENSFTLINLAQGALAQTTGRTPLFDLWVPSIPEPDNPSQTQLTVEIAQPLPIWGTPRLARHAGALVTERWRHELERLRLEIQTETKKIFNDVLYHQERVAAITELDIALREIVNITRARLEEGDIAEVDLIKGEADYEHFALKESSALSSLAQARTWLARVLGNPGLEIKRCIGKSTAELPDISADNFPELYGEHPQIRAWEAAVDAAEAQMAVTETQRWPVPTLALGYRHYDETNQDTFDLSLSFDLPLFDRNQGAIQAAREQARYERASINAEWNAFEATVELTITSYRSHKQQAEAYEQRILPRMEEVLFIVQASFEAGETNIVDVLLAHRTLAEARLAYLETTYMAQSAYTDLNFYLSRSQPYR